MKTISVILVLALTITLCSCSSTDDKLIGEWVAKDKFQTGNLLLNKDNSAVLVVGNQVIGGDGFEMNGVKVDLDYEIDYSKEPIWLDIVFRVEGNDEEKARMKGIVRFITDTKIEYRLNWGLYSDRYTAFDPYDKENTLVLNKVSK